MKRWIRTLSPAATGRSSRSARLRLTPLDERVVPAVHGWIGASGGSWSVASNWINGVPTSNDSGGTIVLFGEGTTSSIDNIPGLTVNAIQLNGVGYGEHHDHPGPDAQRRFERRLLRGYRHRGERGLGHDDDRQLRRFAERHGAAAYSQHREHQCRTEHADHLRADHGGVKASRTSAMARPC